MARFVIQEHHASHLHWDFRLEMNGVLKSWTIPKQPPRRKGIKRLAIKVEDHALSYANFEGEIKEGYGKGTVKIWDKGKYELVGKEKGAPLGVPQIAERGGKIEFELSGKKLKGKYVLVNAKLGGEKKNWLFIKI
jgi:bifunctional non-homologous end joining protein LigD